MLTLVRFMISQDDIENSLTESEREDLAYYAKWGPGKCGDIQVLQTAPLPSFSEAAAALRNFFARIHGRSFATEQDVTDKYTLVITDALTSYDYDYCVPIGLAETDERMPKTKTPPRLVAIPSESVEYQTARYRSGVYWSRVVK